MQKSKNRGAQKQVKKLHSRLLVLAAVLFVCLFGFRMITLTTGAGAQKKQITEKQNATAEIQKENARYEDELRQLKEGLDIRPIIERIAHELGLVYPGERVFKSAGQ